LNWKTKITDYLKGNAATGIDLTLLNDDKVRINFVVLQKRKNIVEISKQCVDIPTLEDLFVRISSASPVFLSINGRGIVHKSVQFLDTEEDDDIIKLAAQIFPNFSEKDFWVQKEVIDSQHGFISVARIELIQTIIEQFSAKGIFVNSVTIGPFAMNSLSSLLTSYHDIYCNSTQIGLKNGIIVSVQHVEEKEEEIIYAVGDEKISNKLLLAYAGSFCFFVEKYSEIHQEDVIIKLRSDFLYKKGYVFGGYIALFVLFIGLLINFVFFDHYNKRLAELSVHLNQSKNLVSQLSELKKELKEKESFFTDNKFLEMSRSSYFADRIAFYKPAGITLTQLSIFPPEKKIWSKDEIKFKSDVILIAGNTIVVQDIDSWIKNLKKESWVKDLTLTNLKQGETVNKTEFELELTIN